MMSFSRTLMPSQNGTVVSISFNERKRSSSRTGKLPAMPAHVARAFAVFGDEDIVISEGPLVFNREQQVICIGMFSRTCRTNTWMSVCTRLRLCFKSNSSGAGNIVKHAQD